MPVNINLILKYTGQHFSFSISNQSSLNDNFKNLIAVRCAKVKKGCLNFWK